MSSFLSTLLMRCDQHDEVIVTAEDVEEWSSDELEWCLASGVLVGAPPGNELACRECAEQSIERIVFLGQDHGRNVHAYLPCPQCGPVQIPPERMRRWQADVRRLLEAVIAAAGIKGDVRELVPRRIWRIGKWQLSDTRWDAVVGCQLWRPDGEDLLRQARLNSRSVVFVPDCAPQMKSRDVASRPIISLRDVVAWDGTTIVLDMAHVGGLLEGATPLKPVHAPRPVRRRSRRAATIETLVQLMKEHVRAARDHARAMAERDMVGLLPRPTQRDLARMAKIPEMAVSRCLRDPAARELRLLWEVAGDLDRLLELPATRSR